MTVQISFATVPGSPDVPNEDAVAASAHAVVVVDGVTAPAGLETGCVHGTPWYATTLAAETIACLAREPEHDLKQALAQALAAVAESHAGTCDLTAVGTPSATVALIRVADSNLDYLVLSDATVAIESDNGVLAVTDNRVADLFGDLRRAVQAAPFGSVEREERLIELVTVQRKLRNVEGGYWLAGAVPEAAEHAVVGSAPLVGIRLATAMSDGASRLVDLFAAYQWPDAIRWLGKHDPAEWLRTVRSIEGSDATAIEWPRYKKSDDATIAYLKFE